MLTNLLNYLKSESRKFATKEIFDIVIYGSFMKSKEEPNDVDIVLIFKNLDLKQRLEIGQKFKNIIKSKIKNPDIKTIVLEELFDSNFLARQGVLAEGYSLLKNSEFSKTLGFKGYSLFTYSLTNLNHNEKTKFTYSLIGRGKEGILKKVKAESLGRGGFLVPIEYTYLFEDFLKKWKIEYKSKTCLIA